MKIALIGNQNSGKTTLFNSLTGENQKVGNWPGVTIAKKEGVIKGTDFEVIDLPGVYSLCPYTEEECVTRDYVLNENPDFVINVIDSTSLERGLFLTTQLLELDVKMIVVLNMTDLLNRRGIYLSEKKLSAALGVKVVGVSAKNGAGVKNLIEEIKKQKTQKNQKNIKIYSNIVENEIKFAEKLLLGGNKRFKIIDHWASNKIANDESKFFERGKNVIEKIYENDAGQVIATERYRFIEKVVKDCVSYKKTSNISSKIDKFVLNRFVAIPIFFVVMSVVYFLSVGVVGRLSADFMHNIFEFLKNKVADFLARLGASNWAISLVVDGMLSGTGAVVSFLPQLVALFFCISLLETSGYMSRISFIFDGIFNRLGLSGKTLVPFIIGSGCSVPAILSTKTIENKNEHNAAVVLTPFVPCSAKLPIIALFSSFFFPQHRGMFSVLIYFIAIFVIVFSAVIFKKFASRKSETFFMELPEYKMPETKYVLKTVKDKTIDFVKRAGTVILASSIIVWFLSSFNLKFQYGTGIENSILAKIGNLFGWFFYPIVGTWNWAVGVCAIQGLIAKEQVVSSMSIIAGIADGTSGELIFQSSVFSCFNSASAIAFVIFNLFSIPCISAVGAMKTELYSNKKTILAMIYQIIVAWVLSFLVYRVGLLLR